MDPPKINPSQSIKLDSATPITKSPAETCWKMLGLPEISCQPVPGFPVKGRVLLSVRYFFFFLISFWWASYWVFSYLERKVNFLIAVSNKNPPSLQRSSCFHFFPAVAFTLDIQPTQQVLIWHSIKSLSCQSPAVSIAQCFRNLHLTSIHTTMSVGYSYYWVALQLDMKGHKVNENSIKALLAFSEFIEPCSELNISFSIFLFNSQYPELEAAETILHRSCFSGEDIISEGMEGFDFAGNCLRVWGFFLWVCVGFILDCMYLTTVPSRSVGVCMGMISYTTLCSS